METDRDSDGDGKRTLAHASRAMHTHLRRL